MRRRKQDENGNEVVVLTGGLTVKYAAFVLMLSLEDRAISLWVRNGVLGARPKHLLTDADRCAIREHRADLIALAQYVEEGWGGLNFMENQKSLSSGSAA